MPGAAVEVDEPEGRCAWGGCGKPDVEGAEAACGGGVGERP